MNKTDIQNTLDEQKQYLSDRFYVKRIGLFGSFLRGEQTDESDIDLLVEFKQPVGLEFIELKEYLEGIFQKQVDLVTPNALRSFMKDQIINEVRTSERFLHLWIALDSDRIEKSPRQYVHPAE